LYVLVLFITLASRSFGFYTDWIGYTLLALTFFFLFLIFRKQKLGFWFELPKYVFLILLIAVAFSSLDFDFITKISILKSIITFLKSQQTILTIATIAMGALVFWMNRDVIDEIEQEKDDEEKAEEKRREEFDSKFKRLKWFDFDYGVKESFRERRYLVGVLRILISPFVWFARLPYSFVKWMYANGWAYSIGLIFVFLVFLGIRLYFIFSTTITVSDDWHAVIGAINILEGKGFTPYYGEPYLRGLYVTLMVAGFFYLFGQSVVVAKFVPLTIGVINFFLLLILTKKLSFNKSLRYVILLIFIFYPWTIFNHWFIRMYVFYEMFLLLIVLFLFKIIESLKSKNNRQLILYFCLFVLVNVISWFFSFDRGKNIILLASFFGVVYLYIFQSREFIFLFKNKIFKPFVYLLRLSKIKKIILVLFFLVISYLFFGLKDKISYLLYGVTNTPEGHIGFNEFFFEMNFIFSILFILSLMSFFFIKNNKYRLIIFISGFLFLVHGISSEYLQIIRGMMYFFPIFLLISIFVFKYIYSINQKENKNLLERFFVFCIILFLIFSIGITIKNNYPEGFVKEYPHIPHEVAYFDQENTYDFIKENLSDYILIMSTYSAFQQVYYNVSLDYLIDLKGSLNNHKRFYYDNSSNLLRQYFINTPVITNKSSLIDMCSQKKCAFIIKGNPKLFITEDIQNFIIDNNTENLRTFTNFKIYY